MNYSLFIDKIDKIDAIGTDLGSFYFAPTQIYIPKKS